MPDFAYIARDLTGNRVEGTLAAGTEREAVAALSGQDLFPLKVATADGRAAGAKRSPRGAGARDGVHLWPACRAVGQRRAAVAFARSASRANAA